MGASLHVSIGTVCCLLHPRVRWSCWWGLVGAAPRLGPPSTRCAPVHTPIIQQVPLQLRRRRSTAFTTKTPNRTSPARYLTLNPAEPECCTEGAPNCQPNHLAALLPAMLRYYMACNVPLPPAPRFVEVLDRYFGNVCELDLIFNFHKAYYILDELLVAGGWCRGKGAGHGGL